jgi:hypothetical protein
MGWCEPSLQQQSGFTDSKRAVFFWPEGSCRKVMAGEEEEEE